MLDEIRELISRRSSSEAGRASEEARRHTLRLATAVLLFEVSRADADIDDAERTVIRTAVQGTFGLSADETNELLRLAESESHRAVSLYEFS